MSQKKQLQDFFDAFDEIHFSQHSSEEQKKAQKSDLRNEFLRESSLKDSDYYYFLGYMGYLNKEFSYDTQSNFKRSLRLDPKNGFCQYYYAYYLFDSERYKEALTILTDIDRGLFEELGQIWRCFKIKEGIVCCTLFLQTIPEDTQLRKFDEFLTDYETYLRDEERCLNYPINYPNDLIKSVGRLQPTLSTKFKFVISRLVVLMKTLELEITFNSEFRQFNQFLIEDHLRHS